MENFDFSDKEKERIFEYASQGLFLWLGREKIISGEVLRQLLNGRDYDDE